MGWERELPVAALLVAGAGARKTFGRQKKGVAAPRPAPAVAYAHRGGASEGPENTLEAFALALEAGAEVIETDAHLSADGEVVLIHDATVDRTTEGSGRVRDFSLEELRRLDAGYDFAPESGRPLRGRGARIPTLREAYERFPGAAFNIDIKENTPGIQERLLKVVREAGAEERTLVASEDFGRLRRFRKVSGGKVATSASPAEIAAFILLSKLGFEDFARLPYRALQVPVRMRGVPVITPALIRAAHRRGVRVDAWTVDDPEEMKRLLDLGVDGIMTDRPNVLAKVLKERGEGPDPASKL